MDELTARFEQASAALERANALERGAMSSFGRAIGAIGRWLTARPEDAVRVASFVRGLAPRFTYATPLEEWLAAVDDASQPDELYDVALERALQYRSDWQFLVDLFRAEPIGARLANVDLTELDQQLRATAGAIGRLPKPDDIPDDHAWWSWS